MNEEESRDMPMEIDKINQMIRGNEIDTNLITDGYHTFGELYMHRIALYIALLSNLDKVEYDAWWSDTHYDGSKWDGWLIVGCQNNHNGEQISYHVNADEWEEHLKYSWNIEQCKKSPYKFDGHTSNDVIARLKSWFMQDRKRDWKCC